MNRPLAVLTCFAVCVILSGCNQEEQPVMELVSAAGQCHVMRVHFLEPHGKYKYEHVIRQTTYRSTSPDDSGTEESPKLISPGQLAEITGSPRFAPVKEGEKSFDMPSIVNSKLTSMDFSFVTALHVPNVFDVVQLRDNMQYDIIGIGISGRGDNNDVRIGGSSLIVPQAAVMGLDVSWGDHQGPEMSPKFNYPRWSDWHNDELVLTTYTITPRDRRNELVKIEIVLRRHKL